MNTITETQDQKVVCNLISQRNRFMSLLTPPPRYTPLSPYPEFTKQQLDMRRKVEILQYKKNSSQTSQPTKSQKWSQISNASSNRYIVCNKNPYISSPTSSCDVPGPVINLIYDPNVPLYNYITNQDVYANFNTTPMEPWTFFIDSDVSGGYMAQAYESENEPIENIEELEIIEYQATDNKNIGTLAIKYIKDSITNYKLTIPIGLFIYGKTLGDISLNVLETVQITKATLNINYYTSDITANPVLSFPITNSLTNTNFLDLSMSFVPTDIYSNFTAFQYIGNIVIPKISLNTSYGFLYDFKLYFEISYSPLKTNVLTYPTFGVYINIPPYDTYSESCIVTPQQPNIFSKYIPYFFSQV